MGPTENFSRRASLAREGEHWTINFGGSCVRLRDSKGIQYLASLLANPGRDIAALALVTGQPSTLVTAAEAAEAGPSAGAGSDLGPVLDASAKRAYRKRLEELQTEISTAEALDDEERAERGRVEWDAIVRELRVATGLAGATVARARPLNARG